MIARLPILSDPSRALADCATDAADCASRLATLGGVRVSVTGLNGETAGREQSKEQGGSGYASGAQSRDDYL